MRHTRPAHPAGEDCLSNIDRRPNLGKVYRTWRDFPPGDWRWPNFSPQEMASKREGELLIDEASMDKLQKLRDLLGKPLLITSAYRSVAHNKAVGGATHSQHRLGRPSTWS